MTRTSVEGPDRCLPGSVAAAAHGSLAHVGIGSDFDGFIKPTAGGLQSIADLRLLREPRSWGRLGSRS